MKRRGGSLENTTIYYIVLVIAIFNIIAYLTVRDWASILCFVLAGAITYIFDKNKTLVLLVAIVAANLIKITQIQKEGLENKKKKVVPPPAKKQPVPHDKELDPMKKIKETLSGTNLEGLQQQSQAMLDIAKDLKPMMKQANKLIGGLPEGFLEKAMQNFNSR